MDKFQYIIAKEEFDKATTIKSRLAIFNRLLREDASPYGYHLAMDIKTKLRPSDILKRHTRGLAAKRSALLHNVKNAKLTQSEVTLVFNNETIQLGSLNAVDAINVCNKTPALKCSLRITATNNSKLLHHLAYSTRGPVELAMLRDKVTDYESNKLYKQLTTDIPSYNTVVAPLLKFIALLEPLKAPR